MSTLGNILWFLLGGLILGLAYCLLGLVYCITIIGIPFGLQLFKIGFYVFLPFGKTIEAKDEKMGCLKLGFNIVWILCGGVELALCHLVLGALLCVTVVGIPFGLQHFKIARLALVPFGQTSNIA